VQSRRTYCGKNEVYDKYFHHETSYTCKINKANVINYGFEPIEVSDFVYDVDMTADEFVAITMTNADHLSLAEPERTMFTEELRNAVNAYGGLWKRHDRVNVVKTRKK